MARPIRAPKALALTLATRPSRCALYGASRLGRLIGPRPIVGAQLKRASISLLTYIWVALELLHVCKLPSYNRARTL